MNSTSWMCNILKFPLNVLISPVVNDKVLFIHVEPLEVFTFYWVSFVKDPFFGGTSLES